MNLADTLRGLWRRWYIVIPGILIAAALAVNVWAVVPPGHERSSTQLLIPGAESMPEGANPYLFLGGLSPAADVMVRAVGSENATNAIVEDFPGTEIEISRDTTTSGPVILITVTAASDDDAEEILGLLIERTGTVLNELQETENIAESNRVTLLPLTVDNQSALDQRSRFIAVAAVGLAGIALTLLVAGLVDGLSVQRKRRKEMSAQQAAPAGLAGRHLDHRDDPDVAPSVEAAGTPPLVDPSSREPDPAPVPSAR